MRNKQYISQFHSKKAFFKKYRDKNPIFLLSECDAGTCGLSRYQNSNRSHYEDVCIKYLKKHKNQNKINYVSFACRAMFQDLVILTKAIKLHGIKNINLHLIDAAFTDYIEACFFENKKVASIDVSNDIDQKLQTFIDQVSMQNKEKISLQATSYAIQLAIQHKQFRQLASL